MLGQVPHVLVRNKLDVDIEYLCTNMHKKPNVHYIHSVHPLLSYFSDTLDAMKEQTTVAWRLILFSIIFYYCIKLICPFSAGTLHLRVLFWECHKFIEILCCVYIFHHFSKARIQERAVGVGLSRYLHRSHTGKVKISEDIKNCDWSSCVQAAELFLWGLVPVVLRLLLFFVAFQYASISASD